MSVTLSRVGRIELVRKSQLRLGSRWRRKMSSQAEEKAPISLITLLLSNSGFSLPLIWGESQLLIWFNMFYIFGSMCCFLSLAIKLSGFLCPLRCCENQKLVIHFQMFGCLLAFFCLCQFTDKFKERVSALTQSNI